MKANLNTLLILFFFTLSSNVSSAQTRTSVPDNRIDTLTYNIVGSYGSQANFYLDIPSRSVVVIKFVNEKLNDSTLLFKGIAEKGFYTLDFNSDNANHGDYSCLILPAARVENHYASK